MERKKQIAIIGTVGLPANYGGFETLTDHLVQNMGDRYAITVYCSGKRYSKPTRPTRYRNARLTYIPLQANGIQSILYDSWSILHALFYADVLLILGVSGAWLLPFVKRFTNKKIIVSIDGIEWKRDKWNIVARWYLWWAERIAVKYSHIDIADNESIQDYTAVRYGTLSRIIEYGGNHTLKVKPTDQDRKKYPFIKMPYAFKVCRIEPENNVHEVLKAFSEIPDYQIAIVGNWNNSAYGRELKKKYTAYANITLLDPIYNQKTLDMLRGNALVYIHGHSAGGTNPSLVEAMYLGLPVIANSVSYNKTTTEGKALYFTDADELKKIILDVSIAQLKDIGRTMEGIAHRRYNWKLIATKYEYLVMELVENAKTTVQPAVQSCQEELLRQHGAAHLRHAYLFFEKR